MSAPRFAPAPGFLSDAVLPSGWHFRLRNRMADLAPLNAQIQACLDSENADVDPGRAAAIHLILDELLTNVIKYGHPGDAAEHEINLYLCLNDDGMGFVLSIEDDGVPFDPTRAPGRSEAELNLPLEEREFGGWGLSMVRQLVDAVEYRRDQSRNRLIIRKGVGQSADKARLPGG